MMSLISEDWHTATAGICQLITRSTCHLYKYNGGLNVKLSMKVRAGSIKVRRLQSPIYVIVHSLLKVSFCTQPFPTPSGWLW